MAKEPEKDGATETLLVISCGKAKVWDRKSQTGAVEARDAYTGPLFKKCRKYAQNWGGKWIILSAKYGLLDPSTRISDYNVKFGESAHAITADVLRLQWVERFAHIRNLISLASRKYDARLREALPPNVRIQNPLQGKNIFERMSWLKRLAGADE